MSYSAKDLMEATGITRGQFNHLLVNGVLSGVQPAGTGNRRDYTERNLGEVHIARTLFDVGFTVPEAARLVKSLSADESKAVAKHPDGRLALLIVDGKPFLDRVNEEMHKKVKWTRSLQAIKIGGNG